MKTSLLPPLLAEEESFQTKLALRRNGVRVQDLLASLAEILLIFKKRRLKFSYNLRFLYVQNVFAYIAFGFVL